ncbi:hypothetical protein JYU10_00470 [bacterium AH-315-J04]|nr:hypothetical protein [bacterium AH-315-J04]
MLAVIIVLAGTIVNIFLLTQYAGPKTVHDGFVEARGDMCFVKWSDEHLMADIEPNALFATVNGKIVATLHYKSKHYKTLQSSGICDNAQRPWINVNHSRGIYHVNRYPKNDDDITTEPTVTYADTDGDGLTDRKVDWLAKKTYKAKDPLVWTLLEKSPNP